MKKIIKKLIYPLLRKIPYPIICIENARFANWIIEDIKLCHYKFHLFYYWENKYNG